MKILSLPSLSKLPQTAKTILEFAGEKKIFCFYGELGAGKTTLIKEICKQLGVTDPGSSPTFGIANEYASSGGHTLYHFDFYRIKSETEAFDFGFEEYLYGGNHCFIEWPEKIERLLPSDIVKVKIEVKEDERFIRIS